jgi:uncharacterized protein (DUF2267 family)
VYDGKFLSLVQKKGLYGSKREATRAANAVFGTIKSWISPAASSEMRKLLPRDAARLWQYSPVSYLSDLNPAWRNIEFPHLVLKIQQAGEYATAAEAQFAYGSVMKAMKTLLPVSVDLIIGKPVPESEGNNVPLPTELKTMIV